MPAGLSSICVVALSMGACGINKPPGGLPAGTDTGGSPATSTGGSSGSGGAAGSGLKQLSCDDIGPEPTIAPACATLLATKTTTADLPTDESILDTPLIQQAINDCPSGQSVKLAADGDSNAFVSGPITMKAGVTLWIDTGVTLFAARDPRLFDARIGACGGNNTGSSACLGLINVRNVADAAIVGGGTIDGRGGQPLVGDTLTWWDLEEAYDGNLAAPRLIQVSQGRNVTIYQVTLRNAAKFHVVIENTNGYRVWGITINTPPTAPNTDGVDPSASTNGIIAYSRITTGDDNVAVKGGGPLVDTLIVAHNHFGRGHGMSIGSETDGGVRNVLVCDLSLDGTDNGLRIKSDRSRGGLVQGITYTDVCMRNVRNPLVFDPFYTSTAVGTLIPDYRDIVVRNTHVLGGGRVRLRGYDAARPLGLTLDNVVFDVAPMITASDANIALGPGPVSFDPAGTGVAVAAMTTDAAAPRVCDDAWVTF